MKELTSEINRALNMTSNNQVITLRVNSSLMLFKKIRKSYLKRAINLIDKDHRCVLIIQSLKEEKV